MHWLPEAHERVAAFVADLLASEQPTTTTGAIDLRRPSSPRSDGGG